MSMHMRLQCFQRAVAVPLMAFPLSTSPWRSTEPQGVAALRASTLQAEENLAQSSASVGDLVLLAESFQIPCISAVLRSPRAEARPRSRPGCWEPPGRRRRPAGSAWSAAPPRWTAAGARTAAPRAPAAPHTSPPPPRTTSAAPQAGLGPKYMQNY